jgi:hypothetical protein
MLFWVRNSRAAFASLSIIGMLAVTQCPPPTLLLSRSKPNPSVTGQAPVANTLKYSNLPRMSEWVSQSTFREGLPGREPIAGTTTGRAIAPVPAR